MIDWTEMAHKLGYVSEPDMWQKLYVEKKQSVNNLSAQFGVGVNTITKRLRECEICIRKRGGGNYVRVPFEAIPALIERVEKEGITAVAASLTPPVDPSTLYKRLYYSQGKKRRRPLQSDEPAATAPGDLPVAAVPDENQ